FRPHPGESRAQAGNGLRQRPGGPAILHLHQPAGSEPRALPSSGTTFAEPDADTRCDWEIAMKRREFLKSMTALAAGSVLPAAPAIWSPAKAQSRQETLLIVSESGPNNIDIHGVGTNVPGYEVSWNCYDRLISHEMKTLPNGVQYYDRDKFRLEHANEKDPWGLEFTKQNTAGSGAYRVVSWNAGTEVILERNDKWTGGPLPKVRRIVWRMVPSAGNRRALLERGDADISYDLPNKDFVELKDLGKLNIVSTPYSNGIQYIGMNV